MKKHTARLPTGLVKRKIDNLISARFFNSVNRRGGKFAYRHRHLPGALPGVGYDYDRVWGGLLNDKRLPPKGNPAWAPGLNGGMRTDREFEKTV